MGNIYLNAGRGNVLNGGACDDSSGEGKQDFYSFVNMMASSLDDEGNLDFVKFTRAGMDTLNPVLELEGMGDNMRRRWEDLYARGSVEGQVSSDRSGGSTAFSK